MIVLSRSMVNGLSMVPAICKTRGLSNAGAKERETERFPVLSMFMLFSSDWSLQLTQRTKLPDV